MSEPTLRRPSQATLAGWLVVAGGILVTLTAFEQAAALHSLDTRDRVQDYLSKSPGDELGLSLQGGLTLLRVLTTALGVVAAVVAVLGWYALRRSRGARLAVTVLAVPMFLVALSFQGLLSDGVFPAMTAAASVILWFQPTRDWYDGRTPPPAAAVPSSPPPVGSGRDPLLDLAPPSAPPLYPTPYAGGSRSAATPGHGRVDALALERPRPASVTWACVLAWLCAGAVFALLVVAVVAISVEPHTFLAQAHRANPDLSDQGVTDTQLRAVTYVGCGVAMAWSAAAAVLALLAWRRVRWAATALAVSAGVASLLCLLTVVAAASLPFLVPLAGCAAALALLLRPESRAWFGR